MLNASSSSDIDSVQILSSSETSQPHEVAVQIDVSSSGSDKNEPDISEENTDLEGMRSSEFFGDTLLFVNPLYHGKKYSFEDILLKQYRRLEQTAMSDQGISQKYSLREMGVTYRNSIHYRQGVYTTDDSDEFLPNAAWNMYFSGTKVLTPKKEIFNRLAIGIQYNEDFTGIYKLKLQGLDLFILELPDGAIEDFRDCFKNLRLTNQMYAQSVNNRVEFSIMTIISSRIPIIGHFRNQLIKTFLLETGKEVILTADRRYARKTSVNVLYVNCVGLIKKLKSCDVIEIDSVILCVTKQCLISALCKIVSGGHVKQKAKVRFPKKIELDIQKVSEEEKDDLNLSMDINSSFIILPTPGCQAYYDSIKKYLKSINYDYCKIMATVELADLQFCSWAQWIAKTYDGLLLSVYKYPPYKKTIIEFNEAAKLMINQCREKKKPIIISDFFANVTDKLILVDPDSHKYFFHYTDGFYFRSNQRQPSHMLTYNHLIDDVKLTMKEYFLEEFNQLSKNLSRSGSDEFARAIVKASYDCDARCIILSSVSGRMAIKISHFRPMCPIIILCDNINVVRYISAYHNIYIAHYKRELVKTSMKNSNFEKLSYGIMCAAASCDLREGNKIIFVYRVEKNSAYPNKCAIFEVNHLIMAKLFDI